MRVKNLLRSFSTLIVVNSNTTATIASFNLSHANDSRKSLARLSSGKRIVQPSDDAGGMMAYKLNLLKRTEAVRQNVQNGISSASPRWRLSTVGRN